jgi:hypothetical protein
MEQTQFRKALEEKLIERSLKDENFRKTLIENPRAALEEELGVKLPQNIMVNVVEEKENEVFFILPCQMKKELELTELELESVAGGWSSSAECATYCGC